MKTLKPVIPLCITLCALLAGFGSILMSAAGEYVRAAQLIMLSMILDGLDGTVARLLKATSPFGAEMDTFVDMASFGIAPAVLAYLAVLQSFGLPGFLLAGAMVASGALRLARFRLVDPFRGQKGYLGLPITTNAGWVTLFILATEHGVVGQDWFTLRSGPMATFVWGCSAAMLFLQVSRVHYHKPTKDPVAQAVCTILVTMVFFHPHVAVLGALTMCVYGFMYAFVTPLFQRHHVVVAAEEDSELPLRHS